MLGAGWCLQSEVGAGCVVTAWSQIVTAGLEEPASYRSEAPSHGRLVQISLLKGMWTRAERQEMPIRKVRYRPYIQPLSFEL